jgi:hypothetical protein
MNDRTSDSDASHLTARRRGFRTNVIQRDRTCVITDDIVDFCDACHIIPHAKESDVRRYDSSTISIATLSL